MPLGQVPEPRAIAEAVGRLPEEAHLAAGRPLQTEREPEQRRLPAAVRACERDELPGLDLEIDIEKDRLPREVAELDVRELDR